MVMGRIRMIHAKGDVTMVWKIEYDDGIAHTIKTKKAMYKPEALS